MSGFRLRGEITTEETTAEGNSIRELPRLVKAYGVARWRKRKGIGTVELDTGATRVVEPYWYEAHGKGRKELKIKRYLE